MRTVSDGCGCFPTGRHYPGIAHLLRASTIGLVAGIAPDMPWQEVEIALLDVETTGRDASVDRVIEVGIAIARGGKILARHNWLVNPGVPIPTESSEVHGIKDADVADKPAFGEVAKEIAETLGGRVPAAYNALFDKAFLLSELARASIDVSAHPALKRDVVWIDPLVWAREIQQAEKSRSLGEVAQRLGIQLERAHRASEDAEAAARVLYALCADGRVPVPYGGFIQEQRRLGFAQADERRTWNRNN
jgi:DNA polymerase-3 subunit epsilon